MTSEPSPEPDPRKKRALIIAGVIAVAAIVWNSDGWFGRDDHVSVTVMGDGEDISTARDEVRDAIRSTIRDEVRGSIRGDSDSEEAEDETAEDGSEVATTGERRLVESASGENQRTFRIEGDDGRGLTISVDADSAN